MATIRLERVSRLFSRESVALREISLDIPDRKVTTVVGPSGCGKSTMLRIIAGLDSPTTGVVRFGGRVVNGIPARERNIAMVFQSYALYPHMTCRENLSLHLRLKGVAGEEIDRRVSETAASLSIEELLDKKPKQLSGGQRQRVALGRAIIRRPEAFLFDEPLSNLDAVLRERVRHELKELFRRVDATVVYVTHDQVEAMTLADQVVVLNQGAVQQVGSPEELYHEPANRFVASFIGSPAMNLFEAQLEKGRTRLGSATISTETDHSGAVTLGIRPEAIRIGGRGDVAARVAWVEPLGGRYLIGARIDSVVLTLVDSERPTTEELQLAIHPSEMHIFDATTGKNLSRGVAGRAVSS